MQQEKRTRRWRERTTTTTMLTMIRGRRLSLLLLALAALAATVAVVAAAPRTRTIKTSHRNLGSLSNSLFGSSSSSRPTCERNVPCGWALYHQTWRSALRPIFQYTRNTLCDCALGTQCVYQENRSEMRAYVFYCRRNDGSKDLYQFPSNS